jgi:formylglycine-generating enzyme required for sulfatase activity
MGIDDRNQHDMVRSMPGGLEGVKQMVADFHRRGVRVLFPMMMWDQGTHDPGKPWPVAIAELMKEIGADGVNGDTQDGVPLSFSLAAEAAGHPLAFEPEVGPADEGLAWNLMTWGQYRFPFVPMIDKFKWLESRHMVNISDRWKRDKTDDLQFAFFNGVGWVSWENIWGIWNGITPRDAEATRRVAAIERGLAPFLVSPEWQPFFPMEQRGAFSSRWPLGDRSAWTVVNRNEYRLTGAQMRLPYSEGMRYYDLYRGVELSPERQGTEALLSFDLEAHGYGAILATRTPPQGELAALLSRMQAMTSKPLAEYSHEWSFLPQQLVTIQHTRPPAAAPQEMIKIPATDFSFRVEGVEIEGENQDWVDVQYPWEDSPRRYHLHTLHISAFWIDRFPVTNADFKKFLDATHYRPKDDLNFLKDWKDGTFPEGAANKPVTWVSLEDAREYARWTGKRLPHEWEWQYAAQGKDGRAFPWGNCDWTIPPGATSAVSCPAPATGADAVAPAPDKGRTMQAASDVDAHPKGASPFGVMDLVGNVWQWTDEYVDEHTRAAILRGGSHYQPQGSFWYFPQAYRNNEHGKLLLMAPSYDRSGAVGFRCVMDAE